MKPYLISRAPEIEEVLKYVESHADMPMMVGDLLPKRIVPDDAFTNLAAGLWGFPALNLQGMARLFVNNSKSNEGFDLWQKVVRHVRSRNEIDDNNCKGRYSGHRRYSN